MARLILPLDFPSADEAFGMVDRLGERADFFKVGLELYTRSGPSVVQELKRRGKDVFLDLKLHDIPNTVAGGVRAASDLGVDLLTVHTAGGEAMLAAAAEAAWGGIRLLGVTILTSMSPATLEGVWGREIRSVRDEVGRLTDLALEQGMHGVVSSPLEASGIRRRVPESFLVVTPGIRPAGSDKGDQSRVATPADAVSAGADYLVVGRPITRAPDPRAALHAVLDEIAGAEESE